MKFNRFNGDCKFGSKCRCAASARALTQYRSAARHPWWHGHQGEIMPETIPDPHNHSPPLVEEVLAASSPPLADTSACTDGACPVPIAADVPNPPAVGPGPHLLPDPPGNGWAIGDATTIVGEPLGFPDVAIHCRLQVLKPHHLGRWLSLLTSGLGLTNLGVPASTVPPDPSFVFPFPFCPHSSPKSLSA